MGPKFGDQAMTRRELSFTVTIPIPAADLCGLRTAAVGAAQAVAARVRLWRQRARERAQLRTMGAHLRRDMNVRYEDCRLEAQKPFWLP
jgi:uncharacterized protein YjiS (DUF1127 family)